jgi:hypothetical protein
MIEADEVTDRPAGSGFDGADGAVAKVTIVAAAQEQHLEAVAGTMMSPGRSNGSPDRGRPERHCAIVRADAPNQAFEGAPGGLLDIPTTGAEPLTCAGRIARPPPSEMAECWRGKDIAAAQPRGAALSAAGLTTLIGVPAA